MFICGVTKLFNGYNFSLARNRGKARTCTVKNYNFLVFFASFYNFY